jgi:acetolactate synthase-1/2/3 large subunit
MRVADWIAEYLHSIGVSRVHGLMGGGAATLNDGFIKHKGIEYICYHHEQGAGHAAIGESKYTGRLSVVNPTTGCGGTNCATSVLNAYQDGVPVLFLSGNVKKDNCTAWFIEKHGIDLRHYGAQEHNIVETVKSMTKYARFVMEAEEVPYVLQKAVHLALTGRPGPVWVDIPADVQAAEIPENVRSFVPRDYTESFREKILVMDLLAEASRPVVIAGQGIRQAGCVNRFIRFVEKYDLPFVTTFGAQDYAPHDHPLNMGAVGLRGTRYGNFAMQNASLLLILGTSMGSTVIGYKPDQFSPKSHKIYVDIDSSELHKNPFPVDLKINLSIQEFLKGML